MYLLICVWACLFWFLSVDIVDCGMSVFCLCVCDCVCFGVGFTALLLSVGLGRQVLCLVCG